MKDGMLLMCKGKGYSVTNRAMNADQVRRELATDRAAVAIKAD